LELLLSTAYAAPVEYYHLLAVANKVFIEKQEYFVKQSYRNRCVILGANGPLALTIPLSERKDKTLTRDIRISYAEDWQKKHWRSLESAYRTSAFYEYFCDALAPFYEKKQEFLLDFNTSLQECILKMIGMKTEISFTTEFQKEYGASFSDQRNSISPKRATLYHFQHYYQLFENTGGFHPNLSIFDLLFNVGNKSKYYLLNSLTFE
jgi:hypothetical protein